MPTSAFCHLYLTPNHQEIVQPKRLEEAGSVAEQKKKRGQPSKKDTIPTHQLKALYQQGMTDRQVADFFEVTEQTINNWKKTDTNFFESLKDWKDEADQEIEMSLYQRAKGGTFGKNDYPPDPTSIIFWLKNRKPKQWRDTYKHEHTGEDGGPIEFTDTERAARLAAILAKAGKDE